MIPTLTADTRTPSWLTHGLTLLIPVVGVVLSLWQPGKIDLTAGAQAAVILGGFALAAGLHAVHVITINGLTKAGLTKDVTEAEAWFTANYDTLRTTFEAAKPALDAIPGVPAALNQVQTTLAAVQAKVDAVPQAQRQAV
ncbi:MAG: hypothetical protein M3O32_22005, partial [Actinomycetota bacterium]|nr:hypothetical protein [Actinomycetota bacterium]